MASRNLKTAEAAELAGMPESTMRYFRHVGRGPKSFKLGRSVRYAEEDVLAWIEAARQESA